MTGVDGSRTHQGSRKRPFNDLDGRWCNDVTDDIAASYNNTDSRAYQDQHQTRAELRPETMPGAASRLTEFLRNDPDLSAVGSISLVFA